MNIIEQEMENIRIEGIQKCNNECIEEIINTHKKNISIEFNNKENIFDIKFMKSLMLSNCKENPVNI